jgi:LPS export ABC transporter protein LptC
MLPANVDMRLSNLVLNETGESGRTMSLNAATAHYFKEENYFLLNDITASVISEDTNLLVFADEGRYAPDQKAVVLTGHVRTEDQEGHVLTSSRLDLNMDSATLTSQGNFCLEDPALSLTGQSFVYNSKTGVLDVNGRLLFMISQL